MKKKIHQKKDKFKINKRVFKNNIIVRRFFVGKELDPEAATEFCNEVNKRRQYEYRDFIKQHFTPDNL